MTTRNNDERSEWLSPDDKFMDFFSLFIFFYSLCNFYSEHGWLFKKFCINIYVHYRKVYISHEGFLGGSAGKECACNVGDLGSTPGLGRSPGEGKGYPLQYSGLENSMVYSPWGHKELDMTEQLSLTEKSENRNKPKISTVILIIRGSKQDKRT